MMMQSCELSLEHRNIWPCTSATGATAMTAGETRPNMKLPLFLPFSNCSSTRIIGRGMRRSTHISMGPQRSTSFTQAALTDQIIHLAGSESQDGCAWQHGYADGTAGVIADDCQPSKRLVSSR